MIQLRESIVQVHAEFIIPRDYFIWLNCV